MDNCKYVVIDTKEAGPAVFLFPAFIGHADFCQRYFGSWWWEDNKMCRADLLAAGFVRHGMDGWYCLGKSDTLNLKSRPEDDLLLYRMLPEE